MTIQINDKPANLSKAHEAAVARILRTLIAEREQVAGHDVVYTVTFETTDYGTLWVRIERDVPTLPQGNTLRVLTSLDGFFIQVGPRGGVTLRRYPRSLDQFKGKSYLGLQVR